jgi:CP family cyanate transporter-like MFS transporter
MLVLSASLMLRPLSSVVLLFAGTFAAGAAIAVGNVLLPALVKRRFGERATFVTGIYSVALGVGAALGAGLAVPSEDWLGGSWRAALAVWAAPALVAALIWLPLLRDVPARGSAASRVRVTLWRDRVAWRVTAFMSVQSILFYSTIAWLPEVYRHEGFSKGGAGALLSVVLVVGIPFGFVVGALAGRMRDQRPIALASTLLVLGGYLGVLAAPTAAPWLWATLLGVGLGACFPLTLALLVLRTKDSQDAAALSGMAQSVGYTLAALGPVVVGVLHDVTDGWTVPLLALVALAVLNLFLSTAASRRCFVGGHAVRPPQCAPAAAAAGAPR